MIGTDFQNTEIGLIPKTWELISLGQGFDFKPNNTLSRDALSDNGKVKNVHYGDILVKLGATVDVQSEELPYVADSNYKGAYYAVDGDIIIADTAEDETVGKATELVNVKNSLVVSGLHTMCLHPKNPNVFAKGYLGYAFNSAIFHNQLVPLMQGTKVTSISKSAIKGTFIAVPPKEEQESIVKALSSIDTLITKFDVLIEKKNNIKKSLVQNVVSGKKRLSGYNSQWECVSIGEVIDVYDGTHQTPNYVPVGVPFYSVENVSADNFENTKYITLSEHELLTRKVKIEKGDVLMTRIGSIGVCKYIDWDVNASYYVSLALLKRRSEKISMKWFTIMTECKYFKDNILAHSLQFAIPMKINLGEISRVQFLLPPIEEQEAIVRVYSYIDDDLQKLRAKKSKYMSIKQGMMQQLLTGKIRLIN